MAAALIQAAKDSVGRHYSEPYQLQIKYLCKDIALSRERLTGLERDIESRLDAHEVGKLLTTIDGIGRQTATRLVAELGDPARFRSSAALASVGVIPRVRGEDWRHVRAHSGKSGGAISQFLQVQPVKKA
ncbi:MAG: transposase [Candidatus Binataceae bacterium]